MYICLYTCIHLPNVLLPNKFLNNRLLFKKKDRYGPINIYWKWNCYNWRIFYSVIWIFCSTNKSIYMKQIHLLRFIIYKCFTLLRVNIPERKIIILVVQQIHENNQNCNFLIYWLLHFLWQTRKMRTYIIRTLHSWN